MKITPTRDNCLLKRQDEVKVTPGGLFIPENATEKSTQAEVLAVGPGRVLDNGTLIPMNVKPGDKVLITGFNMSEIKLDNESYYLVSETQILGVFE